MRYSFNLSPTRREVWREVWREALKLAPFVRREALKLAPFVRREALKLAPFPCREGGWGLGLNLLHSTVIVYKDG